MFLLTLLLSLCRLLLLLFAWICVLLCLSVLGPGQRQSLGCRFGSGKINFDPVLIGGETSSSLSRSEAPQALALLAVTLL